MKGVLEQSYLALQAGGQTNKAGRLRTRLTVNQEDVGNPSCCKIRYTSATTLRVEVINLLQDIATQALSPKETLTLYLLPVPNANYS
jgi:hypothetical protein